MLLNDEATLTASVAGPVERNIFSFLSFPFLYNVVFLFLLGVWCVCVCAVVCVTCPYTQKGARAHTQTDTWWFTGCVPTCLLSVLWCRVLARDGDGTDTAENLTQQAKRPPSSLLLSIIYLLLLLLLILLLKIFFFWKLWTPRQWLRPPQEENQRIVRIFQLKKERINNFHLTTALAGAKHQQSSKEFCLDFLKRNQKCFQNKVKIVMQFRFIVLFGVMIQWNNGYNPLHCTPSSPGSIHCLFILQVSCISPIYCMFLNVSFYDENKKKRLRLNSILNSASRSA